MIRDRRTLFLIGLYAVVLIVGSYAGYRMWAVNNAMAGLANTALGQFQGPADAEKVIVEIMDYRCPFCRALEPVMKDVLARNPDVKIVYRHYPIFVEPSILEAQVALAAGMQGKFKEAHNYLIARDQPITQEEIDQLAMRLGLDMERFRSDMKGPEIGALLWNTLDVVEVLRVPGTPTFVVGDIIYPMTSGMATVETIEKLLAEAYGP